MKKLLLGVLLSVVMVFSVACGEEDPIEVFEKAVEKTNEIDKYKSTASIGMDIKSPEMAETEAMIANAGSVDMNMDMAVEEENVKMDLSYTIMGMTLNMEMYGNLQQSIIKMPMENRYIVMDNNMEENVDIESMEADMKELSNSIYMNIADKVREDGELTLEEEEIEIAGETKDVRKGTLKLSDQAIKDLIASTVEDLYSSEDFMSLMNSQQLEGLSEEDMEESIGELKEQLKNISIEGFEFTVYIDDSDYIVRQDIKMNIVMDPENSVSMDMVTEISEIGEAQNIEFPELTEENSINYEDYIKEMEKMFEENMQNINPEDIEENMPEGFDFNLEGGSVQ